MRSPRLRGVDKVAPPYRLNAFPPEFAYRVAEHLTYWHITSESARFEGAEWERVFADAIGAEWKPSNVGLDDIVLGCCAWGAKSAKHATPARATRLRLVSGRNSPAYSFEESDLSAEPNLLGKEVLQIWNSRVDSLRARYPHLRTVVLIKSRDMLEFAVFELETVRYPPDLFTWARNRNGNLEGRDAEGVHRFTWQPHGSQFTIIEAVPTTRLAFRIRKPGKLDRRALLEAAGFDKSWVEVLP